MDAYPRLAEDLMVVKRREGEAAYRRRLAEAVEKLAPHGDAVLLTQFSTASALPRLQSIASALVLSAPHSSARRLRGSLSAC